MMLMAVNVLNEEKRDICHHGKKCSLEKLNCHWSSQVDILRSRFGITACKTRHVLIKKEIILKK